MNLLKEPLVCFDVDDTLVTWAKYGVKQPGMIGFIDPYDGAEVWLDVITEHVDAIKSHKLRGHTVVIWSAGGAEWAREVIKKLNLEPYVDACMAKPNWYYDDIPSNEFMPEHNRKHARVKGRL